MQLPGINDSQSTGAPGSTNGVQNALDPTGDPTTELVTPTNHSDSENVSGTVFGVGGHDSVADNAAHGELPFGTNSTDTGAGNGTPGHKNGRS